MKAITISKRNRAMIRILAVMITFAAIGPWDALAAPRKKAPAADKPGASIDLFDGKSLDGLEYYWGLEGDLVDSALTTDLVVAGTAPAFMPGQVGQCIDLSGSLGADWGFLMTGSHLGASFTGNNARTINAWVNVDVAAYRTPISTGDGSGATGAFDLWVSPTLDFAMDTAGGGGKRGTNLLKTQLTPLALGP